MNILITGGAGFIGSNFVHYFINKYPEYNLIILDKLTYAGSLENLLGLNNLTFIQEDICNFDHLKKIFLTYNIDGVIHFAAESHVDNSINDPSIFMQTNIIGTQKLLEVAKQCWGEGSLNKFVHISTDEVYGSLNNEGFFTEESLIKPNSPYSSSKASSDLVALAYAKTYKMNVTVTNCSNNYGPRQHKEKLIPHIIDCALNNEKFPVYGTGENIRDWLYVEDHCRAIDLVFHKGKSGERYNIGGNNEVKNIDIIKLVLKKLNKSENLIKFVKDRKGHDFRYAIDSSKIKNELGWISEMKFEDGINKTIDWYLNK